MSKKFNVKKFLAASRAAEVRDWRWTKAKRGNAKAEAEEEQVKPSPRELGGFRI